MTQLDRYIAWAVFRAIFLVAVGLAALFSLLEFVRQLASIGQGHYHLLDAVVYVVLTAPARLVQVTPVSGLIGSLLALGALGRGSELMAMRSLGISRMRIIGSVLKLAAPIILVLFVIAQFVVPPAQQRAQALRASALFSSTLHRGDNSVWVQKDHQFLNVRQFGYDARPQGINIFSFAADGRLKSYIHADRAKIGADGVWHLGGVLRKRIVSSTFRTDHLASLDWHAFISRRQIRLLLLSPGNMPPVALYWYVRRLEHEHRPALRYRQALWAMVAIPLSIIALMMIAGPFVFGLPREQSAGRQIMIGAILGAVFTLVQQIVDHLDLLLALDPGVATLAPPLLLMGLTAWLFTRRSGF